MVKLRLKRMGRKKKPIYKIVAADARSPRDGRVIEEVGFYDPNANPMQLNFKEDRIFYWLNSGAQPTDTVRSLIKREGLLLKRNLIKRKKTEEEISGEMEKYDMTKKARGLKENEMKLRRKANKKKKAEEKKEEKA